MVTLNGKCYAFGGIRRPMDLFSDRLYCLEIDTTTPPMAPVICDWTLVRVTGDKPSSRSCASLTVLSDDKTLIMIGGCSWDNAHIITPLNDVHTFDSLTNKWTKHIAHGKTPEAEMPPRWGHTCQLYGGNLYIFGKIVFLFC